MSLTDPLKGKKMLGRPSPHRDSFSRDSQEFDRQVAYISLPYRNLGLNRPFNIDKGSYFPCSKAPSFEMCSARFIFENQFTSQKHLQEIWWGDSQFQEKTMDLPGCCCSQWRLPRMTWEQIEDAFTEKEALKSAGLKTHFEIQRTGMINWISWKWAETLENLGTTASQMISWCARPPAVHCSSYLLLSRPFPGMRGDFSTLYVGTLPPNHCSKTRAFRFSLKENR